LNCGLMSWTTGSSRSFAFWISLAIHWSGWTRGSKCFGHQVDTTKIVRKRCWGHFTEHGSGRGWMSKMQSKALRWTWTAGSQVILRDSTLLGDGLSRALFPTASSRLPRATCVLILYGKPISYFFSFEVYLLLVHIPTYGWRRYAQYV